MICEVNGELTPARGITFRGLGFGDPVEASFFPYTLKYDLHEVRDLIAEDANAFVRDMKLDYELTGDTFPEYLHDLGYPTVDVLVQHEAAFCDLIETFLRCELFERSFPWTLPDENVRWVINNVETIRCRSGIVEVLGRVYRMVG